MHRYFYKNNLGLFRPTEADVKISYRHTSGTPHYNGHITPSTLLSHIFIYKKYNDHNNDNTTEEIFAHTIHELTHHAHSTNMGNIQFWQVSRLLQESWAEACEWAVTNKEYHDLGSKFSNLTARNHDHRGSNGIANQFWEIINDELPDYSPLFIDLIDDENQRIFGTLFPTDNINGYSIDFIENNILKHSFGISSLRKRLKHTRTWNGSGVPTISQIDEYLNNY